MLNHYTQAEKDEYHVAPETMLRYYTATEKKKTSDEILTGLADRLRPKVADENE